MGKVKVSIANNQTQVKIPVGIRLLVRRCCHAVTEYEGFNDDFEVSVSFVDDETIHKLNLEHRNTDRATDVLSFPLGENGKYDLNRETGAYLLGDRYQSGDSLPSGGALRAFPRKRGRLPYGAFDAASVGL